MLVLVLLATGVFASKNKLLMKMHSTEVTSTQTKMNPDGTKINIYFAQFEDSVSNQMVFYKKVVDESKRDQQGYNPEVYFRYASNQDWRLLPKGCPAPEIKPKVTTDRCEMGWKIGKKIATVVSFYGLRKGEDDTFPLRQQESKPVSGSPGQVSNQLSKELIERTRAAINDAANRLSANAQECLKKQLTRVGFTVERVCLHKGLVAESATMIANVREHFGKQEFECDYNSLSAEGQCVPV